MIARCCLPLLLLLCGCAGSTTASLGETRDASIASGMACEHRQRVRTVSGEEFRFLYDLGPTTTGRGDRSESAYLGVRGGYHYLALVTQYHIASGMMGSRTDALYRCRAGDLPAGFPGHPQKSDFEASFAPAPDGAGWVLVDEAGHVLKNAAGEPVRCKIINGFDAFAAKTPGERDGAHATPPPAFRSAELEKWFAEAVEPLDAETLRREVEEIRRVKEAEDKARE